MGNKAQQRRRRIHNYHSPSFLFWIAVVHVVASCCCVSSCFGFQPQHLSFKTATSCQQHLDERRCCHPNTYTDTTFRSPAKVSVRRMMRPTEHRDEDDICHGDERQVSSPTNGRTTRRNVLLSTSSGAMAAATATGVTASSALAATDDVNSVYRPAIRPLAYYVDSTIPPTLLPLPNAGSQSKVLQDLGRGKGTDKSAVAIDTINLNNMLNKFVFGTIDSVTRAMSSETKAISGPNYSSYVCLGVPEQTTDVDIQLAVSLSESILQGRKNDIPTALGIAQLPYSTQPLLSQFKRGELSSVSELQNALLSQAAVSQSTVDTIAPLLQLAQRFQLQLIALAPEPTDVQTARRKGIQFVDAQRRGDYVVDPQGFIDTTNDSAFKMYADKSLFKDFKPIDGKDVPASFLVERMLVHEAAASAVAKFGYNQADALVLLVAPIPDVRFLQGINGRIPRIVRALNPDSLVTTNAVTTILCNPTAKETTSLSNYLRLEIGTGPDTLNFQQKVADYVWFSKMPKVNLLPRLMNA